MSEVLDPRTRQVIQLAHVSDYVMSNEMVSAALAMVSECRDVNAILKEILSSQGNEIYVRDADEYIEVGTQMSFWQLMSTLRCHGLLLLGYEANFSPEEKERKTEAIINPDGKERKMSDGKMRRVPRKDEVRTWLSGDKIVVLAED